MLVGLKANRAERRYVVEVSNPEAERLRKM